ncbi:ABC-2 type transport system permease protein [Streptomonospora nanhaiensis]|uniref:ABC-2 type transport system permease protein n=1 Tax=Streptomonospora nanhaiensis TaxID=1323731 RepID=A0A853BUH5_9ACTN|nr:ABC transporter permease [Streptomonospora nanhaiensis]NYI98416.1 ABC-2 type transport system permease protein [Streptomonospora nanhaiensis]
MSAPAPGARTGSAAGTAALVRLVLRRDRLRLPLWYGLTALFVVGVAAAVPGAYPTEEARQALVAATAQDPTQLFAIGPVHGSSVGAVAAWRPRGQAALLLSIAGILLVVRHTRAEEASGRRELLGATAIGRQAPLTAVLVVAFAANLLAGLAVGAGLTALGSPAAGSFATGLSFAASGCVFAAVAAVAAQLTESPRAAIGLSAGVMAACYAVRGVADLGAGDGLSWLSPFGWVEHVRPFAGDHWWALLPAPAACAALLAAAYAVSARRDLGRGAFPARPGRARASALLRTPAALAWRGQRGTVLAWTAGMALFGAGVGAAAPTIAEQLAQSPVLSGIVARAGASARPVDGFFAFIVYLSAQVVTVFTLQAVLRLRAEEASGRLELLLSGPVGRLRWALGHLLVAAAGAYTVLAVCLLLELAVDLLGAPHAVLAVSPFALTPGLPAAPFALGPVAALCAVAAGLTGAGLAALARRDLGG